MQLDRAGLNRITFAVIGTLAGLAIWGAGEWADAEASRMAQTTHILTWVFFGQVLILSGPLPVRKAGLYAAGLSAIAVSLYFWASFRFDAVPESARSFNTALALLIVASVPLPFFVARETAPGGWRDYAALFDTASSMSLRALGASVFCGLFWLAYRLCEELLGLVGIDFLEALSDKDWFVWTISGLTIGLALQVLNERRQIVTTLRGLIHHLVRLLLPPIALAITVFIVAIPIQGLDAIFGAVSSAATLLAMTIGAIGLITASVDEADENAARHPVFVWTARLLALLLPVLPGVALYAIYVRVAQYGWSPDRVAAATVGSIALGYAVLYALAQIRRHAWRSAIRLANIVMALIATATAAMWLTPLLNAERISAQSHVARYLSGALPLDRLDLWRLEGNWGVAGQEALRRLETLPEDHPAKPGLANRIADYRSGKLLPINEHRTPLPVPSELADDVVIRSVLVRPEGAALPEGIFRNLEEWERRSILDGCDRLVDGQAGCVLVLGTFFEGGPGPQGMLLYARDRTALKLTVMSFMPNEDGSRYETSQGALTLAVGPDGMNPDRIIRALRDGAYDFAPVPWRALSVDGVEFLPDPRARPLSSRETD